MNIFISFSGEAREQYAIQFMNFFNKFGLHCWYDQHELFLGANYAQTECQFRYCGTAIPFLTVRSTAR